MFLLNINVIESKSYDMQAVVASALFRQANIFVHIKGDHMLKADLARCASHQRFGTPLAACRR